MAKNPAKKPSLSDLARRLLADMRKYPDRVEYNTRPLGGAFTDDDLPMLDAAYKELQKAGYVESAHATISFFGKPKSLFTLTTKGRKQGDAA